MPPADHPSVANDQRQARLDARLALYAQYASLVGDEITAAWSDDPHEAAATTREIARARAALAADYEDLRASSMDAAAAVPPDGFGDLLAEAVTEQDHQSAVERALRAQLERLRGGVPRLGPGTTPALAAHGATGSGSAPGLAAPSAELSGADASETTSDAEPLVIDPPIGAALLAARSNGVGGMLGGRYPGIAAGADAAAYVAPVDGSTSPDGSPSGTLDVRF